MIAIVDYGAGNLFSVQNALAYLNITCCTTDDPAVLEICDGVILPGVGAFPEAMHRLHASGLVSIICEQAQKKPLLGICLGMQMLFERSYEFEETQGLGLIPGQVRLINSGGLKIPHMGWNDLTVLHPCALTEHSKNGEYVYFVHSYCVHTPDENVSCYTEYGERIPALVHRGFVYGAQFHPEKSGEAGLAMLKNFARLCQ
ncbi:imidazole glycerol phosphate synthase subunit HisH [Anaerotruncus colihominis]|uniref:Imidazole glycerol phosphate synthase subunit HisH n=1 Tax=Anaerotruncus colihominis TaxID=169435 RepID=A0A1Y4N6P4_9FIRM|nr:imidazole glycerol phosphate synthase subunit HisH [Anaerotruncus colihominis]OUP70921.1 imidazole glycerol phosphate synthase subunit HisH [Anaerotruncus colihominis]OUP76553.1 imidazole glycerol phosphate synthase subunit HisH [Anaerotruncus colihominis]